MNAKRARQGIRLVAMALLVATVVAPGTLAQTLPPSPPEAVLGQAFSLSANSVSITSNLLQPADLLGANGQVSISCIDLGLLCVDPESEAVDNLEALSFGGDFNDPHLPPLQFSVSAGAQGVAGSAVAVEAGCTPAQAQADVFETALDGTNLQDLDGDGTKCNATSTNSGFGLGLAEGATADNLDALAQDPCQTVDLDCNGSPEEVVLFVLGADSPTLALLPATAGDILLSREGAFPEVWAAGVADLGLQSGDAIDALCVFENGDGLYGEEDEILFSLAQGSPSLTRLGTGPGALLQPGPLSVVAPPSSLGLADNDDVDALACGAVVVAQTDEGELLLPAVERGE